MCLAVPGRLIRWLDRDPPFCSAEIQFDGITRVCNLSCVPDAQAGDFVIVHAGVAISTLDAQAAAQILDDLARMAVVDEAAEESP
jgi:hydrogenase expression/formation protein HypC